MCGVPFVTFLCHHQDYQYKTYSFIINNRSKQEGMGGSKELQTWPREPALNI